MKNIYLIGFGTYIARNFGHKNLYCDNINHFSISIVYQNGNVYETFPIDVVLNRKEWSDILRAEGSVVKFPALPVAYIHLYRIPIESSEAMDSIIINDKYTKEECGAIYKNKLPHLTSHQHLDHLT